MKRYRTAALVLVASLGGCAASPGELLSEAAASTSQTLCSKVFVAGLDPRAVFAEHLRPEPGMGLIAGLIRYDIDREARSVVTTVGGRFRREAVWREGRGCTLTYPGTPAPQALVRRPAEPARLPPIAGPEAVATDNPALRRALDMAFAESGNGSPRMTKAIVIVKAGKVIAERYAPGYGVDTPLLSHSIAKSVVNALIGILVQRGDLSVTDPAPVAAWRTADGPNGAVTVENLMRMNAGFGFDEGIGAGIATHMWYTQPDMAAFAAGAVRETAPGEAWGYSSRSYVLLSRIIGDRVGGGPQGLDDFARRELFDPLGMSSVTLEYDASGTLMGANSLYATPRDWARFGLLYLHDGVIDGRRILPEGWVGWSTRPTGGMGYGAGFWLNTTDAKIPTWGNRWGLPGAPKDAFMARGYMGQYIVVVPSEDLVVVRFGQSHGGDGDIAGVGALVRDVVASVRAPAQVSSRRGSASRS